jgi:hypothetical protein
MSLTDVSQGQDPVGIAIAQLAAGYPPDVAARISRLAHALPEDQAWELLQLVGAVDHAAMDVAAANEARIWLKICDHMANPRAVLELVRAHVSRGGELCRVCGHATA